MVETDRPYVPTYATCHFRLTFHMKSERWWVEYTFNEWVQFVCLRTAFKYDVDTSYCA